MLRRAEGPGDMVFVAEEYQATTVSQIKASLLLLRVPESTSQWHCHIYVELFSMD